MKSISNAFFWQAEVIQVNRWELGPLEMVFFKECRGGREHLEHVAGVHEWNNSLDAGYARPEYGFETAEQVAPGLTNRKNPNIVLVPTDARGVSQLDVMLASLLPEPVANELRLERKAALLNLTTMGVEKLATRQVSRVHEAFGQMMWSHLAPRSRLGSVAFSPTSSLRLLAGDTRFWMSRFYRVALERREQFFPETKPDDDWRSLDEIREKFLEQVPPEEHAWFTVRRPLMGGTIWDGTDEDDRLAVIDEAIGGAGVMESLAPVIEVLHTHRDHDDFSPQASWIKEDFERSFYSKRAKLKVDLVETVDDVPVWTDDGTAGYGQALFRDLLAFLDPRERRLTLALRMGKTVGEIADESNLRGHASVSRRVEKLKAKISRLLD